MRVELHHFGGEFEWLELSISHPVYPMGLHVEVAPREALIRCSVGGVTRIWAHLHRYCQGVTVLGRPAEESPGILPPWGFASVRAPDGGTQAWWARRIANDLVESTRSPLSRGNFGFARTSLDRLGRYAAHRDCEVEPAWGFDEPDFFPHGGAPEHFHWEGSFGVVLPLRTAGDLAVAARHDFFQGR